MFKAKSADREKDQCLIAYSGNLSLISNVGEQGEVNLGFFLERNSQRKSINEADTLCKPHIKL